MADEDEELPDDIETGSEGEGPEGQSPGEGDDEGDLSAVESDAPSGEDERPQHGDRAGESGEEGRPALSRGQNRVQRLANELRELREENARKDRERQEEQRRQAQQAQQWDEHDFQQRLAVMTPEEQARAWYDRGRQEFGQSQQQLQWQMQAWMDKTNYEANARVNPVFQRYQAEVERQYQQFVQQGRFIPRETLLKQMIGERAISSATKDTKKARAQGQKKIESHTTRPSSSKGDASSQRGKAGDSAEKRLAGVEI